MWDEEDTLWDKFLDIIGYWPVYRFCSEVRCRIRRLPYFLTKWWEYTKLLWNDWDFDYLCLLRIIELKTKRTREYLVKENLVHVDERTMREVQELARRAFADDYNSKELDALHEAHPGAWRRWIGKDGLRHSTMEDKVYWDEVMRLHKKGEAQLEADLDRLFMLIRKHIRVWWS